MRTTTTAATLMTLCGLSFSALAHESNPVQDDTMEGTVVKAQRGTLLLRMHGAVIPVHVTPRTRFEGARHQLKEFTTGEQVRVSLRNDSETLNEARSVGLSDAAQEGTGGSGAAPEPAAPKPDAKAGSAKADPKAQPVALQPGGKAGDPNQGVMTPPPPDEHGTPSGMTGQPQRTSSRTKEEHATPSGMMGEPQR